MSAVSFQVWMRAAKIPAVKIAKLCSLNERASLAPRPSVKHLQFEGRLPQQGAGRFLFPDARFRGLAAASLSNILEPAGSTVFWSLPMAIEGWKEPLRPYAQKTGGVPIGDAMRMELLIAMYEQRRYVWGRRAAHLRQVPQKVLIFKAPM